MSASKLKKKPHNKKNAVQKLSEKYHNSNKASIVVYLIIRSCIILIMIRQALIGEWHNVFLCGLSLVLLFIPFFLRTTFRINFPGFLEIAVFVFVFAAEILGEIANFYGHIPFWDTMLHTVTGFLAASVGFGMIDLLNTHSKKINMTPLFVTLVSFCFSMTVGVVWEFAENTADTLFGFDTQKDRVITSISSVYLNPDGLNKEVVIDNIAYTIIYDAQGNELALIEHGYLDIGLKDTMKDMWVNMLGAIAFCLMGFLYIRRRDGKYVDSFDITPLPPDPKHDEYIENMEDIYADPQK